jgi:hypothetical protein
VEKKCEAMGKHSAFTLVRDRDTPKLPPFFFFSFSSFFNFFTFSSVILPCTFPSVFFLFFSQFSLFVQYFLFLTRTKSARNRFEKNKLFLAFQASQVLSRRAARADLDDISEQKVHENLRKGDLVLALKISF